MDSQEADPKSRTLPGGILWRCPREACEGGGSKQTISGQGPASGQLRRASSTSELSQPQARGFHTPCLSVIPRGLAQGTEKWALLAGGHCSKKSPDSGPREVKAQGTHRRKMGGKNNPRGCGRALTVSALAAAPEIGKRSSQSGLSLNKAYF